jgi:CRP/FNR family transcriptional regulator, cyclic AMP receptor protein
MLALQPLPQKNEALDQLLQYCHRRRHPARTAIIKPGDPGDTLYYIVEGSVAVILTDEPESQEIVLAYLNKGEFIGEIGVFMGAMARDVTVKTREPCQLATITYQRLNQLLKQELASQSVEILHILGRQLSRRLMHASRKVSDLAFLDVAGRIAHTLIDLCRQPDAMTHPDGMQIRVTRQEIGRLVGCSREMAGKVLKALEDQGLISANGKTIVVFGTR